jgi:hypothetical protein
MAEGVIDMNESVYLTCPHCGEQLAFYVDYAAYARIRHTAVNGDGALRKYVARYILTHGLDLYWVAFLSTSILAGISAGGFLHGFSPLWLFWLLFAVVDITLFGTFIGLLVIFINSNIRRRDTLLRLPEITKDAISILEHKDTSPVICVSGVDIESAQGGSHELRMLNSKNNKRDMWGQTRIDVGPADYGNFGLPNPYYPKV